MDAQAYLIRHGWSGPGNPLNPDRVSARGGLGLTKPLLVARRKGNSGVGNKTTKDPTNQWWLRGFEDALKGVGTSDANAAAGTSVGGRTPNALTSELYRFFVRGEVVPGTLGDEHQEKEVLGKRKRSNKDGESKEERKRRKEEKRQRKEERRQKKEEKRRKKAEKALRKEKKKEEKVKEKKEKKPEGDYPTPVSMDLDSADSGLDQVSPASDTEKPEKQKQKQKQKKEKKEKKDREGKEKESPSDESSKRKSKRGNHGIPA